MKKVYFTNGGITDVAEEVPIRGDQKTIVQQDNKLVAIGNTVNWVDLPAFSAKWVSHAKVAYASTNIIAVRGHFESVADNNTDPFAAFPENYKPVDFTKVVSSSITSNPFTDAGSTSIDGEYGVMGTSAISQNGAVINLDFNYIANENQSPN